jgi:hypothetical protein
VTEIEPEDDLGVVAAEGAGVDVAEEGRADGAKWPTPANFSAHSIASVEAFLQGFLYPCPSK